MILGVVMTVMLNAFAFAQQRTFPLPSLVEIEYKGTTYNAVSHIVRKDETWASISLMYHVPFKLLMDFNARSKEAGRQLKAGDEVLVPMALSKESESELSKILLEKQNLTQNQLAEILAAVKNQPRTSVEQKSLTKNKKIEKAKNFGRAEVILVATIFLFFLLLVIILPKISAKRNKVKIIDKNSLIKCPFGCKNAQGQTEQIMQKNLARHLKRCPKRMEHSEEIKLTPDQLELLKKSREHNRK